MCIFKILPQNATSQLCGHINHLSLLQKKERRKLSQNIDTLAVSNEKQAALNANFSNIYLEIF